MTPFWFGAIVATMIACLSPVWVGALTDSFQRRRERRAERLEEAKTPQCNCRRAPVGKFGVCPECLHTFLAAQRQLSASLRFEPRSVQYDPLTQDYYRCYDEKARISIMSSRMEKRW